MQLHVPARYSHKRFDGWNTYIQIASYGVMWISISGFISYLYLDIEFGRLLDDSRFSSEIHKLFFFSFPLALLFAIIFGMISKLYFKKNDVARLKKIKKLCAHNPFENMLLDCANVYQPIMITTNSRKVYVGLVIDAEAIVHGKLDDIIIMPLLSGYREEESLKVIFTTNYYDVYNRFEIPSDKDDKEGRKNFYDELKNMFSVVVPTSTIVNIRRFDQEIYKSFHQNRQDNQ